MKPFITKHYNIIFLFFVIVIAVMSFVLGYEEGRSKSQISDDKIILSCSDKILEQQKIIKSVNSEQLIVELDSEVENLSNNNKGIFVGSKNGTKYYTPGCSGTKRIKPENYIWFQTIEDATLQGYSKGSC